MASFDALKPTVGKTITSILLSVLVAAYVGITYFIGGMVVGTVEAGVQAPLVAGKATAETFDAGIEGRDPNIDVSPLEDAAKRPVELAMSHAGPAFLKTFLWVYGIWSALQFIGTLRKKK